MSTATSKPAADPTTGDPGGAKSDEHYRSKWGQIRRAHPLTVDGLNRYAYTGNNPMNRIDPSGHELIVIGTVVVVVVVAAGVMIVVGAVEPPTISSKLLDVVADAIEQCGNGSTNAACETDLFDEGTKGFTPKPPDQEGKGFTPRPPENASPGFTPAPPDFDDGGFSEALDPADRARIGLQIDASSDSDAPENDLPEFDGTTTAVLVTDEGETLVFQSGEKEAYDNYPASGHAEGKVAIWMRENGVTDAEIHINHPDGICGMCVSNLPTLLPDGATLTVNPPQNANPDALRGWYGDPRTFTGNTNNPRSNIR